MHLSTTLIPTLLSLALPLQAWTLSITLPSAAPAHLPHFNPSHLPSTTKATLTAQGLSLSTPLNRANAFDFADIPSGSYLLTVQCRDYAFPPARVDFNATAARVDVWQTFWGNAWENRGEWRGGGQVASLLKEGEVDERVDVEIAPVRRNEYYTERAGFSVLSFLKNPMILMGLFSLVLIVGMPMLMDSMDEETKAEFEEMQKTTPSGVGAAQSLQNFDLAGWLSGGSKGSAGQQQAGSAKQ